MGIFGGGICTNEIVASLQFQFVLLQSKIVDGKSITSGIIGRSLAKVVLIAQLHIV
jgi:hypothetical protein